MNDFEKTWVTLELMDALEPKDEDDRQGCLTVFWWIVGTFLSFCVLGKFGFEPHEVWGFIKKLFFPSFWDYQGDYGYDQSTRIALVVISGIGLFLVYFIIGIVIEYISDFVKRFDNFILKVISLLVFLVEKSVLYLFIINLFILIFRFIFHCCAAFLVWLW
ncbi:hypothetical protein [Bacillus sp. 1P06AnD]|uniref:hypothetical protein n=1 Tax=Bacillus sp. 1P06AnD TaxID=3132208 RepID=UPI00399FAC1D